MNLKDIPCKFCKEGTMHYSQQMTYNTYSLPDTFVLDDIDKIVDGIIAEYLVYVCRECGSIEKFTYKELEKLERKRISKVVIDSAARGEIIKVASLRKSKVLIYCGKCGGLSGKGDCLLEVYKKCELKKLPLL